MINKSILVKEYCLNKKTMKQIATELQCSISYVSQSIKAYKLKIPTEQQYIKEKFGKLTIMKKVGLDKHSHIICKCKCDCGNTIEVLLNSLISGNTTTCGCSSRKSGQAHKNYRGYKEIRGCMWQWLQKGAKERGLQFNISLEYVWLLYEQQNKKCLLSGLPIFFAEKRKMMKFSTASLDRIDNSKGYIIGNVRWVHKRINKMRQNMSDSDFIYYCSLVSNNFGKV